MDVAEFKNVMDLYLQSFLDLPSNSKGKKVVYAGYLEHLEQDKREKEGIPLHVEVVNWFEDVCKKLNLDSIK
jgi:LDH2 family malate/lactate/ureidoglycolate dehydrogenase